MSRVFKSPYVNVGKPLEVILDESEFNYKRQIAESERSSDLSGNTQETSASIIIDGAQSQAADLIEKARMQAERILSEAQVQANNLKNNAADDGYNEGYKKGMEDGRRETEDLAQQALIIKQELEQEKENLIKDLEPKVVALIIQSVRKIISCELKTNPEIILNVVANVLNKVTTGEAVVRVSETDFSSVTDNIDTVKMQCKEISNFEVKKDLSLDAGDCVVETSCGNIDGSIDVQLEKFEDCLLNVAGNGADAKNN